MSSSVDASETLDKPEMTCRELVELVTAYLEGALPVADHARFERHLATCHGCTAYLEEFRETIQLTGRLRESDVSPTAESRLLDAFREWKRGG